ncbi:hypothetical protein HDU83_005834 [Entophlyctis luteolus]|nr:hypothetical protein HDU83_005834 [Entophlyctis luteolus]KAJ3382590.1 hypothetical protein HDU84_004198 [Entophlyctis sp. JEL0112]
MKDFSAVDFNLMESDALTTPEANNLLAPSVVSQAPPSTAMQLNSLMDSILFELREHLILILKIFQPSQKGRGANDTIEESDSSSRVTSINDWQSHIDTTLSSLQYTTELSGTLLKLSTSDNGKASWKRRFFVLTPDPTLFMFRTSNNSSTPITHLCVESCSAYSSQKSPILELSGEGVDDGGQVTHVSWILKCENDSTLRFWVATVNRILASSATVASTSVSLSSAGLPKSTHDGSLRSSTDELMTDPALLTATATAAPSCSEPSGAAVRKSMRSLVLRKSKSSLSLRAHEKAIAQSQRKYSGRAVSSEETRTSLSFGVLAPDEIRPASISVPNPVQIRSRANSDVSQKSGWFSWFKRSSKTSVDDL